jgi:hypothetical protein
MLPLLLAAGLTLVPIELGEPVLDACVADIDADGQEDIVAVTKSHLVILPGGRLPAVRREVAPLAIVGRGLLGVVRDGRYRAVEDPLGAWKEGAPGEASLLALLGRAAPRLLLSPGDLDGDGRDDPVLCGPEGFATPAGLVPLAPAATLEIDRNEVFAVEYRIPVPIVGSWTGAGTELVLFDDEAVRSFRGALESDKTPLPLPQRDDAAAAIRRNHVFVRDVDADGRLDLLVLVATGETRLFAKFEATGRLFRGGRIYDAGQKRFHRPASFLKVPGVLLEPALVDVDGDGDLDLVLCTIDVSVFSAVTATAPATYHVFRWTGEAYELVPLWSYEDEVPLSAFVANPEAPVRYLPDYDGDGQPSAVAVGDEVRLLHFDGKGLALGAAAAAPGARRPAAGRQRAAVPYDKGLIVVEKSR